MKKIKHFSVVLLVAIFVSFLLSSCSSTTMITSEPAGAKVFLNNAYAGNTPYAMTDTKFATTCTAITLQKDGYRTLNGMICKDEKINIGAAIGGFFIWPIWLWVYDYQPEHKYILKPSNTSDYSQDTNQQMKYTVDDEQQKQQTQQTQTSKAQKLQDLKKLYDDGVLSKDEYEKEKEKILEQEEW